VQADHCIGDLGVEVHARPSATGHDLVEDIGGW
jgi:hypothetical protein